MNQPLVKDGVAFFCPFCADKQQVMAGFDAQGLPVVFHSIPVCEKFDELKIDEFLRQARLKMSD